MTLGFVSAAALMMACGDDESGGPNGNGGTANNGGSAGNANGGSSGNTAQGGSSGANNGGSSGANNGGSNNGGTGGGDNNGGSGSDPDAGDGGGGPPCTGCVELRVPVTAADQGTQFIFSLGGTPLDMSTAKVTYSIRALTLGNQLFASPFAQDADFGGFQQRTVNLDNGNGFTSTDTVVEIEHDLSAVAPADIIFVDIPDGGDAGPDGGGTPTADPADFDKSRVSQFGLNVFTGGTFTPEETTIVVLVDAITFEGVARTDVTFDDSAEGFAINTFGNPRPGSELIHHPAD